MVFGDLLWQAVRYSSAQFLRQNKPVSVRSGIVEGKRGIVMEEAVQHGFLLLTRYHMECSESRMDLGQGTPAMSMNSAAASELCLIPVSESLGG